MIAPARLAERGQPDLHLAVLRDAKVGVKIQGAAPVIAGQAGVAGDVVGGSEAVVRAGALVPVADLAGQAQGGGVLDASLLSLPGSQHDLADTVERLGLTCPVTDLTGGCQCPPVAAGRLLVLALAPPDDAQVGQGGGLGRAVTGGAGSAVGVAVNRHGVRLVAAGFQVPVQGGGEAGGVAGPAARGGVHDHGHQGRPVRIKPGSRPGAAGHRRRGVPGAGIRGR